MIDPYIGELLLVPFGYAPSGWALCNGQLLPINQYQALFSILGTRYGGNGTTTFALPDLRGRRAIHSGQLTGGSAYVQGEQGGVASVTLTLAQVDPLATDADETTNRGSAGTLLARGGAYASAAPTGTLGSVGSGQPHDNLPPYLVLNWIIALVGIFPSRD